MLIYKSIENKSETIEMIDKNSKRTKKGYYRRMIQDKMLYDAMTIKYAKYIAYSFTKQCRHEFDTQMNESMNNSVAFYAPKGHNFSGTTS